MNILINEAYTDANIGSGALVENTINIIKNRFPNANIRVMAHYPQAFIDRYNVDAVQDIFQYPFKKSRLYQVIWLIRTLFYMFVILVQSVILSNNHFLFYREKVKDILWADIVVSVGAERINDQYIKNIPFSLFSYWLVTSLGRKMVLFPCTIGPFLYKSTRWLTASVFKKIDLIYTRDDLSFNNVSMFKGIDIDRVINTSDVAVYQKQSSQKRAEALIGTNIDKPMVGISAIRWTYVSNSRETPYSNYDAYVREMAKLADGIIQRYNVHIVYYPTNYPIHGCREDDIIVAREIREKMLFKDNSHVIEMLTCPSDFKGMLSCSEVNITTRMHACILSTGAYVPTISINYLFKLSEYMNSLGLGEFSIDIEEFNAEWTLNAFDKIWKDRLYWRSWLYDANNEKIKQLNRSMEKFDALLRTE